MKFQPNDILENRNGIQIVILFANQALQEYHYEYVNTSAPQFQGKFCHKADDIEQYWNLATVNNSIPKLVITPIEMNESLAEFQSRSRLDRKKECIHDLASYVGFTESYKYCKICDEKFKA